MPKRIVANPRIQGGEPCFEGTRIQAWVVQALLNAGETPDEIADDYPSLTTEDISHLGIATRR